jgi:hypothetical protein
MRTENDIKNHLIDSIQREVHGKVRAKFTDENFQKGETYTLTAYLPDDQRFAVLGKTWATFINTEEEFLGYFERVDE